MKVPAFVSHPPSAIAGTSAQPSRIPALSKMIEYPGDPTEISRLLQDGNVDAAGRDAFGLGALHKFMAWDKPDLVRLVLPYLDEAEINRLAGTDWQTPLHLAADAGAARALASLLEGCDGKCGRGARL